MKICVAQTNPVKGDIAENIEKHKQFLNQAVQKHADMIVFPELSLTGYEPELAKELATTQDDKRLDVFQEISNRNNIVIAVGLPTREGNKLFISMIIFQPGKERITYAKQYLYPTEINSFTPGKKQVYLTLDKNIIAPAICYELSNPEHSKLAFENNANIYIASVLNSVGGVDEDIQKLSAIARKYGITVFMANYVGQSGGYQCAGKTSVWNKKGVLIGQLNDKEEGFLLFDTETNRVMAGII